MNEKKHLFLIVTGSCVSFYQSDFCHSYTGVPLVTLLVLYSIQL